LDHTLFRWINDLADTTTWANGALKFYAGSGVVLFAVLLLVGFLLGRKRRDHHAMAASIWAGGAPLVALIIGQSIGRVVDRNRPYNTLDGVHLLLDRTTDFSFPSDHATMAGAVAIGLFFVDDKLGWLTAFAALLMAFARVYVGAHYPGDVAAGLLLGASVAAAGRYFPLPMVVRAVDRGAEWRITSTLFGGS